MHGESLTSQQLQDFKRKNYPFSSGQNISRQKDKCDQTDKYVWSRKLPGWKIMQATLYSSIKRKALSING